MMHGPYNIKSIDTFWRQTCGRVRGRMSPISTGKAVLAFYILKLNVKQYITIYGDDSKHRYGGCMVSTDNR
jgi:hypothetical protein